jgi:hypothetical protein
MPFGTTSGFHTFIIQLSGNRVVAQSLSPKMAHFVQRHAFAFVKTESLCAFAFTRARPFSLACSPKFADDHGFLVLSECAHNLAHQFPRRIIPAQIRFCYADQPKAVALQIVKDAFLHHQIPCETIQSLNQYQLRSVGVKGFDQGHECGAVFKFLCAGNAFFTERLHDANIVGLGINSNRFELPGEAISTQLALAADTDIGKRFFRHLFIVTLGGWIVNYSVEKMKMMKLNGNGGRE